MARRVALAVVMLVVALGIGLRLAGVEVTPVSLAQKVQSAGNSSWGLLGFVALYVIFTTAAVPAMFFHIAAGAIWGFWPALLFNVVLANAVSYLHFAAARLLGAGPLKALVARRKLDKLFEKSRTEGPWLMIAARQLPLPQVAVNVAAGASAMPWWHFAVGSGLGGLVPQALWTWFAAEVFQDPTKVRPDIILRAAAAAGLALAFAFGMRRWARRRAGGQPG